MMIVLFIAAKERDAKARAELRGKSHHNWLSGLIKSRAG